MTNRNKYHAARSLGGFSLHHAEVVARNFCQQALALKTPNTVVSVPSVPSVV